MAEEDTLCLSLASVALCLNALKWAHALIHIGTCNTHTHNTHATQIHTHTMRTPHAIHTYTIHIPHRHTYRVLTTCNTHTHVHTTNKIN